MDKIEKKVIMDNDAMLVQLRYLVDSALYSLIPIALTMLITAIFSNSLTVFSMTIDYSLSLVVHLFAHQSIRAIIKSSVIKFPYGTGKLENFSAFLYGALTTPMSLYILYSTICRLIVPPQSISFSYVQLAMIPAILRALYLFNYARRLNNQTDSPMAESYYVNFKITTLFAVGVLLAFTSAVILTYAGYVSAAGYIDPAVSLILALYMLYNGVKLTADNFKILMDLPLPEEEQLKIMNILAREFENYESIGNIYTRRSGRQRFLDIELYLKEDITIKDMACLQSRMKRHLEESLGEISFNLIPLPYTSPGVCAEQK